MKHPQRRPPMKAWHQPSYQIERQPDGSLLRCWRIAAIQGTACHVSGPHFAHRDAAQAEADRRNAEAARRPVNA